MKNHSFLLIFSFLTGTGLLAQKNTDTLSARRIKGESNAIAFGLYLPVGVFSATHIAGAGIDYSWTHHRFGRNIPTDKPIGFIANGGINYYTGKKITTTGYDFRYGGYINLYAMPGILYNPLKNGNVVLTAGPALNIYKESINAGIGINLFSNYFLSENIAIGPGIIYMKHTNTDALWATSIRASYVF
jgi:hypothetical protein